MMKIMGNDVRAFLLAAGRGTRLRPLTDKMPKCLVPIGGKPLLQHWLEALNRAGIKEALVNTHWLHEEVNRFAEKWDHSKVKLKTVFEPTLLGSAGTIATNAEWAGDASAVLIIYADNFPNMDLNDIISFHINGRNIMTLGVFKSPTPERCGIIEISSDGKPVSFIEKPKSPKSDLAAAGLYVISTGVIKTIAGMYKSGRDPFDLGFHVFPKLIKCATIHHLCQPLIDVGTPDAYAKLCKYANSGN